MNLICHHSHISFVCFYMTRFTLTTIILPLMSPFVTVHLLQDTSRFSIPLLLRSLHQAIQAESLACDVSTFVLCPHGAMDQAGMTVLSSILMTSRMTCSAWMLFRFFAFYLSLLLMVTHIHVPSFNGFIGLRRSEMSSQACKWWCRLLMRTALVTCRLSILTASSTVLTYSQYLVLRSCLQAFNFMIL